MRHFATARPDAAWMAGSVALSAAAGTLLALSSGGAAVASSVIVVFAVVAANKAAGQKTANTAESEVSASVRVHRDSRVIWVPLWISLVWLFGTYAAFWTTGLASKVTDAWRLHAFIASATGLLALGYLIRIKRYPSTIAVDGNRWEGLRTRRRLIVCGSMYLATFGLLQMQEYGATDIGSIIDHIQDPGAAYQAKFDVYALQEATGRVSLPMQIVTLAGALYGVAGPLLVLYWRKLNTACRIAGVSGIAIFGCYFLFIGTQKGLGDIVVMVLAGALAGTCGTWWPRQQRGSTRRRAVRYTLLAITAFLVYMISAQTQRAQEFGTQDVTPASPAVAAVIGEKAATGVAATLFYPTHGYLGLSYNLGTPFAWTHGLGSFPVVAGYATQYLGIPKPQSYPVRTESRTGWPAGMYWATIYPWLASDLTFPGAAAVMLLLGWWLAKTWVEGAMKRDFIALVIFGQLAIVVAYIPANNQIGMSRPTTIGLLTLFAIYVARSYKTKVEIKGTNAASVN